MLEYDGIFPFSKNTLFRKREIENSVVVNVKKWLMSMIGSDNLVDGYTEEIELLFNYHGVRKGCSERS
mgnify:CR=1 FL=1